MLRAGGMNDVYTLAPSALICAEPVVVRYVGFDREARLGCGERGVASVKVIVCRERAIDALAAVSLCEHILRTTEWEGFSPIATMRIAACDTEAPGEMRRDSSGRFTCDFTSKFTTIRRTGEEDG